MYYVEVSSDMGIHKVEVFSPTGPRDLQNQCHKKAAEICYKGFQQGDTYFPANRVNYAKVVEE